MTDLPTPAAAPEPPTSSGRADAPTKFPPPPAAPAQTSVSTAVAAPTMPFGGLLGRPPFAEANEQAEYAAFHQQVVDAAQPRDIFEAINARDYAIEEIRQRRARRAASTLILLRKSLAAREILDPGANYFAPGNPGYAPGTQAYDDFIQQTGERDAHRGLPGPLAWSDASASTTVVDAAIAELAKAQITAEGLTDVACRLSLGELERLENLAARHRQNRDQALETLQRRRERRSYAQSVQVIDAEVDE